MRNLLPLIALVLLAGPAHASQQAHDALHTLQARHLVPAGAFHGGKSATRGEISDMLNRLAHQLSVENRNRANQHDFRSVKATATELGRATDSLEQRTDRLEDSVGTLHDRT
jgi:hypothetical protein